MKNLKPLLGGMASRYLTPYLILISIGVAGPTLASDSNDHDAVYWCVLEHRELANGQETTKSVKEHQFRLGDRREELHAMNLDSYSAYIDANNGALTLSLLGPKQSNSTAAAELPIERLQTSLLNQVDASTSDRFVFSCERQIGS